MAKRLIITPPAHPGVLALLFLLLLAPFIWGFWIPRALLYALAPLGLAAAAPLATVLLFLSPLLGFLNVVVKSRFVEMEWVEMDFMSVLGIPVPVAKPKHGVKESMVAVNIGGAMIPLVIATLMAVGIAVRPSGIVAILASTAAVALITYRYSRIVDGVGVVVPGLLPSLASVAFSLMVALVIGIPILVPSMAYVSAVYGTLLGADVLNLWLHGDRIRAWLVSIGGAGTFDGIFMGGVVAMILAAALF